MSADNWAQCPRCADRRLIAIRDLLAKAEQSYGNVPVTEFDQMRKAAADLECEPIEPTFREDYEIFGAEVGEVVVSYSGSCTRCGLALKFDHFHPLRWAA